MARPPRKQPEVSVETYRPARPLKNFRNIRGRSSAGHWNEKALSPASIIKVERRYKVMELRKAGYTIQQIAWEVGVDVNAVMRDLQAILKIAISETMETTEECRQLEVERLDALLKAYYPTATEPLVDEMGNIIPENMAAAALVLRIQERRAKLLALDKPEPKGGAESGIREYVGVNVEDV